jgi:hypothetical protein
VRGETLFLTHSYAKRLLIPITGCMTWFGTEEVVGLVVYGKEKVKIEFHHLIVGSLSCPFTVQ